MTVYGTIAEYNPFHKGHKYLLDRMHIEKDDCVVVVMAGNFVQRGEPACMLPASRCDAALRNGADLIIQLPLPWALAGAQKFALGSVSLLKATNCINTICFGSECGNIEALVKISQTLRNEETIAKMKEYISTGISFASARQKALKDVYPGLATILDNPNDNLGIEYLNALIDLDSRISPMCIKRFGSAHDSDRIAATASGKVLRKMMASGEDISPYLPASAYDVFKRDLEANRISAGISGLEKMILYKLRVSSAKSVAKCPDVSEGIENCIISAAREATTLDELYSIAKSKRYSHARVRRIVVSHFLGVTAEDCEGLPPYLRVIGFNEKGRELMRKIREESTLPIVTKYADVKKLDARARHIYDLECKAADIYALSFSPVLPCGNEQRLTPVKVRSDSPIDMDVDFRYKRREKNVNGDEDAEAVYEGPGIDDDEIKEGEEQVEKEKGIFRRGLRRDRQ